MPASKPWPHRGDRACEHEWARMEDYPPGRAIWWECAKCDAVTLDDPATHRLSTGRRGKGE
jgi:hypothetical protein